MVASGRLLAQNPGVTDVPTNGRRPRPPEAGAWPGPLASAVPVPELAGVDDESGLLAAFDGAGSPAPQGLSEGGPVGTSGARPVTDEDRNRFGILLDHAAERGLLDPREYEARLRELAGASSVEQMRQIVTDLPILAAPPGSAIRFGGRRIREPSLSRGGGSPGTGDNRRSSPWLVLVVLVVVLAAALVFFVVYGDHIVHTRTSGLAVRPLPPPVSVPGS